MIWAPPNTAAIAAARLPSNRSSGSNPEDFPDKRFARSAYQQRLSQGSERRQASEQRKIVIEGLAEADAGIDDDILPFHSGLNGKVNLSCQEILHLLKHIIIARFCLHCLRCSLHVHEYDRNFFCGNKHRHLRIEPQRADVVDDVGTLTQCRPGNLRFVGINGDGYVYGPAESLDDGQNPLQFLLQRYRVLPRGA